MDSLINTFHIDWKLMLAQLVNFVLVFYVLRRFALKPLMKVMKARSAEIEKGLKDAESIRQKLAEAEGTKAEIITQAKKEAQGIVEKTYIAAERLKADKMRETRIRMDEMVTKTKSDLEFEKKKIVGEAKNEIVGLVIGASEKLLEKNLDTETNRKFVEKTLSETEK